MNQIRSKWLELRELGGASGGEIFLNNYKRVKDDKGKEEVFAHKWGLHPNSDLHFDADRFNQEQR
jgi:hypothetical protein